MTGDDLARRPTSEAEALSLRPARTARRAAASMIAVVFVLLTAYTLNNLRHANEQADRLVGSLTKALDYQVESSLKNIDSLLSDAVERIARDGLDHPTFAAWAATRTAALAELHVLAVTGRDGRTVRAAPEAHGGDAAAAVDISDRERFRYHRDHPADRRLHVGDPQIGRFEGRPVIPFSRVITGPDGEFRGLVTAVVDPRAFVEMLGNVALEDAGGASVIRRDGIVLARMPDQERTFGLSVADSPLFADYIAQATQGVEHFVSKMDGNAKIVGFRVLEHYPVAVTVGLTTWTALADWRSDALLSFGVLAVLAIGLYRAATLLDHREHSRALLGRDLARQNARLEYQVGELREVRNALAKAKAEAERASVAKSQFLAAAGHDLRQPLQALTLYFWSLARKLAPEDALLVSKMEHCLAGLNELLTDLLDLSKLDAGVLTPKARDFPVAELFERVIGTHQAAAESKGLRLTAVPTAMVGCSDTALLERVLGNLVSNAIRYTDSGGVVVGCRRRRGRLWVEVWDTGIGIPQASMSEIFEEFRQLANPERSRDKGSGLGLAIVRKTLDLLGLRIEVRSRQGRGSVFAFEMPPGAGVAVAATAPPPRNAEPLRIALLEDDPNVRQAMGEALRLNGHEVVAASTVADLLQSIGDRAPQLVIADYRLADQATGLDAIATVRQRYGAAVQGIVITGDTDPAIVRAMAGRGLPVLHKPTSIEALQACIAEVTGAATPAEPATLG